VGSGPSGKTWPRWASQRAHITSVRVIPWLVSVSLMRWSVSNGCQKLGQPEPELYLCSVLNRGRPQQTQVKVTGSFTSLYSPVKGGSVPFWRVMWYWLSVSSCCHWASDLWSLSMGGVLIFG